METPESSVRRVYVQGLASEKAKKTSASASQCTEDRCIAKAKIAMTDILKSIVNTSKMTLSNAQFIV